MTTNRTERPAEGTKVEYRSEFDGKWYGGAEMGAQGKDSPDGKYWCVRFTPTPSQGPKEMHCGTENVRIA